MPQEACRLTRHQVNSLRYNLVVWTMPRKLTLGLNSPASLIGNWCSRVSRGQASFPHLGSSLCRWSAPAFPRAHLRHDVLAPEPGSLARPEAVFVQGVRHLRQRVGARRARAVRAVVVVPLQALQLEVQVAHRNVSGSAPVAEWMERKSTVDPLDLDSLVAPGRALPLACPASARSAATSTTACLPFAQGRRADTTNRRRPGAGPRIDGDNGAGGICRARRRVSGPGRRTD